MSGTWSDDFEFRGWELVAKLFAQYLVRRFRISWLGARRRKFRGWQLVAALASSPSLARFSLSDGSLGDEGMGAVLPLVRANAISTLELRSNRIGNHGAGLVAEALAGNSALRTLDLQRNDIKDQGAIGLAAALQVNTSLQVLNVRFNEVADAGAAALWEVREGLRVNGAWEAEPLAPEDLRS